MKTKQQVGSAPGVFQKRKERNMGQYRYGSMGQSFAHGNYEQANNNCEPQKEERPIYVDIPMFMEGIERGETKTLVITGVEVLADVREAHPMEFVFAGSSNLWLMPQSNINGRQIVRAPTPLDTFRLGAPSKVSWPMIDTYAGMAIFIENRCPARNAPSGRFIARLSCVASPGQTPF